MKKRLFSLIAALLCAVMLVLPASALTVPEALELLEQVYLREIPAEAYQAKSLEELFALLGDPYTYYMTEEQYKAFLDSVESTTDVVGIGVSIQYTDQGILVVEVLRGGSAYEAGIQSGDLIVAIEGEPCVPAKESHAKLIRGEAGTEVTVTVLRDGATQDYTLTRRQVVIPNTQVEVLDGGIGYINCDSFGSLTGSYFSDGITEYDDMVSCWLVDLRGNPGGYTDAAGEATSAFVGPCYYLYLENRQSVVYGYICTEPAVTEKPVIVLLDANSASASEALSANLRDAGRGISIGARSYGKGVAQIMLDQEQFSEYFDGDGMKVTTYRFYSVGGNTTDQIGVIPTLLVDEPYAAAVAQALCGSAEKASRSVTLDGKTFYINPEASDEVLAALYAALPPQATVSLRSGDTWVEDALWAGMVAESRWFNDVYISSYANEINAMATYRLLLGDGNGSFRPKDTLTRAELCAMLAQVLNVTYTGTQSRFTDVPASAWYFEEVNAIAHLGLVNGVGGGRFNPNAPLTQQEFFAIMGRTARYLNFGIDAYGQQLESGETVPQDAKVLEPFASWAKNSAAVLAWGAQTILETDNGMLYAPLEQISPKASVLREEAAAGMYAVLTGLGILNA